MPVPIQSAFHDTFVGAALTTLTSHTPDLGAAYTGRTYNFGWSAGINHCKLDGSGFLVNANNDANVIEEIINNVSVQNCEVNFTITSTGAHSGGGAFAVIVRGSGADTGYTIGYYGDTTFKVWRYGATVAVIGQSVADDILNGETRRVQALVKTQGAIVYVFVYVDGELVIQCSDSHANRQTAAGDVRMRWNAMPNIKIGSVTVRNFAADQVLTPGSVSEGDAVFRVEGNTATLGTGVVGETAEIDCQREFEGTWARPDAVTYPNVWSQAMPETFIGPWLLRQGKLLNMLDAASFAAVAATLNVTTNGGYVDPAGNTAYIYSTTDPNGTTYSHTRAYYFNGGGSEGGLGVGASSYVIRDIVIRNNGKKAADSGAANNGYNFGDGVGCGSGTLTNCHGVGAGKHNFSWTMDKQNSITLWKNCSANLVSPFDESNPATPVAIYMTASATNTGNSLTLDGFTVNYNAALVGSASGSISTTRTDILIHNNGTSTAQQFSLIQILNSACPGKIVQNDVNADLLLISGTRYGGLLLAGNYVANGILTITDMTASSVTLSWTAAISDFDDVTDQVQYRVAGSGDDGWTDIQGATSSPFTHSNLWRHLRDRRPATEYRVKHDDGTHTVYSPIEIVAASSSSSSSGGSGASSGAGMSSAVFAAAG